MDDLSKLLQVSLVNSQGGEFPCEAQLTYTKEDPFAVKMFFYPTGPSAAKPTVWVFARELLWEGLEHDVGLGDVKVNPSGEGELAINLYAPTTESATVLADKLSIAEFLQESATLVPYGNESELFAKSLDEKLAGFFGK